MGGILSGISAILSGGVTGLLGVVFQRYADYKNKQLDLQLDKQRGELELAKMDKEAAIMQQEWAARTQIAKVETDGKVEVSQNEAFAESLKQVELHYEGAKAPDGWIGKIGWLALVIVDAFRNVIRPLLTLYLCVIASYLYWEAHLLLGDSKYYTAEQALALVSGIIDTILYLWVTCTTWWFGTRNKQEAPAPIRSK